jgi:nucleotide-binding universal stress UspA family protein
MRPGTNPDSNKEALSDRRPGRSFQDSARPLGEALIAVAPRTTAPTEENFSDRAKQAARQASADPRGVAERAKVIGVLRKAEEFMRTANPPPSTAGDVRRALGLASGRLGLSFAEYRALADRDPELVELERRIVDDARERAGLPPLALEASPPRSAVVETPEISLRTPVSTFARIFVPVDFSMASHESVAVALDLRRTHGSAVCLYYAVESTGGDEWLAGIGSPAVHGDWVKEGEGRLRRFLANVAPDADPGIEVRARIGFTLRNLSLEAHRWGATLVIVRADCRPRLFGSFADRLVRTLELPVLILPL